MARNKSKYFLSGTEWLFIIVIAPVILFFVGMIDVPFAYWLDFSWIEYFTPYEIILMAGPTILVGWLAGFFLIALNRLRKM